MKNFKYSLDEGGNVIGYGPLEIFDNHIDGSEPFTGFDIANWKKDLTTSEWIYLPDITPVNKEITEVRYDWSASKCYITIADLFNPGPHEFDCTGTWSDIDCQNAINSKFP